MANAKHGRFLTARASAPSPLSTKHRHAPPRAQNSALAVTIDRLPTQGTRTNPLGPEGILENLQRLYLKTFRNA